MILLKYPCESLADTSLWCCSRDQCLLWSTCRLRPMSTRLQKDQTYADFKFIANVRDHRWLPVARPMPGEERTQAWGVTRVAIRWIALLALFYFEGEGEYPSRHCNHKHPYNQVEIRSHVIHLSSRALEILAHSPRNLSDDIVRFLPC